MTTALMPETSQIRQNETVAFVVDLAARLAIFFLFDDSTVCRVSSGQKRKFELAPTKGNMRYS
jgi:hypothetical protein